MPANLSEPKTKKKIQNDPLAQTARNSTPELNLLLLLLELNVVGRPSHQRRGHALSRDAALASELVEENPRLGLPQVGRVVLFQLLLLLSWLGRAAVLGGRDEAGRAGADGCAGHGFNWCVCVCVVWC